MKDEKTLAWHLIFGRFTYHNLGFFFFFSYSLFWSHWLYQVHSIMLEALITAASLSLSWIMCFYGVVDLVTVQENDKDFVFKYLQRISKCETNSHCHIWQFCSNNVITIIAAYHILLLLTINLSSTYICIESRNNDDPSCHYL